MASFDENGKYIKTNWKAGDKITATKLNKIEESIEAVNDNDISRHVEADARLDALEAKDVAHDKEFTNVKNTIADNKAAAELGDYEINSRMTFLENELNEGIEEVYNVASTVDGKIATAEANMAAQVNQGKADMEAMVAEVESMIRDNIEYSFNHNNNKNGTYILPGGLCIQWGAFNVTFDEDVELIAGEIPYNEPFKSLVMYLSANTCAFGVDAGGTLSSSGIYPIAYPKNNDSLIYQVRPILEQKPVGTVLIHWLAIGI